MRSEWDGINILTLSFLANRDSLGGSSKTSIPLFGTGLASSLQLLPRLVMGGEGLEVEE